MRTLLSFGLMAALICLAEAVIASSIARGSRRSRTPAANTVVYFSKGGIRSPAAARNPVTGAIGKQNVELLRFVTAYRTGIEAMVDMTPYTPLLKAAVAADNLTMYTFIDTWVSNNTEQDILYMNNVTGQCYLKSMSQGNGWSLSASLLFWPRAWSQTASKHPRESVNIASGHYGGKYPIGRVGIHKANVTSNGSAVFLDKPIDFSTVKAAMVYDMPAHAAPLASLIGYVSQRVEVYTRAGNTEGVKSVMQDAFETMLWQAVGIVTVTSVDNETHTVQGKYNGSLFDWKPEMPVFFASSDVYSDHEVDTGRWLNVTLPLDPVGKILVADGENVTVWVKYHCLPGNWTKGLPKLLVPESPEAEPKIRKILERAKKIGIARAVSEREHEVETGDPMLLLEPSSPEEEAMSVDQNPWLLEPIREPNETSLISPSLVGRVNLEAGSAASDAGEIDIRQQLLLNHPIQQALNISAGKIVTVVTQERHGRLFEKNFDLNLEFGDRVLLQLAVTGHGWAETAEQCGEYCHAVYRLRLNGKSVANVTQFRNDCKDNPINGSVQYGTWDESRNGWCPGTVVPGLFMDMTDHVQKGSNTMIMDLVVWSNASGRYLPYTDYAGFVFDDLASLSVGLSAMIYNGSSVEAIRNQDRSFTAAEKALREGCSDFARLNPPDFVPEPIADEVLLQVGSRAVISKKHNSAVAGHHHSRRVSAKHVNYGSLRKPRFEGRQFHYSRMPVDLPVASFVESSPPERKLRTMARAEAPASGVAAREASIHLHQRRASARIGAQAEVDHIPPRFDFEQRAPWYLYNETFEGPIDVTHVPIFENKLMQARNRDVDVHIDPASVPQDWEHVALHFHLHKPDDLDYDHWDRVGSVGLRFVTA